MNNRTLILDCALDLFANRGYDAVGVQEVAEAAGITKPTLYHYYGSKHGLLQALVDAYLDPLNHAVQIAADYQGDLPGTLDRLARAYFNFAQANPVFYRMLLALSFAPRESEAYQLVTRRIVEQYALVEGVFKTAVREHGNMQGRHRLYAATFIGLLNTCISLWLNGYGELDDELIYKALHQFQHGIYS